MTPDKFKKTINLIFYVLLVGMLAFIIFSFVITTDVQQFLIPATSDIFLFIVPAVLLLGILFGNSLFKKLNHASRNAYSLKQKTSVAFTSNLIRYALIEGAIMISVIAFLGSANLFYAVFVIIGLLYFLTLRPTNKKIKKDLNLNKDECDKLGIH